MREPLRDTGRLFHIKDAVDKLIASKDQYTFEQLLQNHIMYFEMLHDKYGQKIYIVMDSARYQHCNEVTEFAKTLNIHILFLPPYSPNLNIIERLWKFAKKTVLYGKYFDSASKFHQEIRNFFGSINEKYVKELKSLLSLKFQKLPKLD